MSNLPELQYKNLLPTRNYLQNICLALGAIQRSLIPQEKHDWHYGLEVGMRGILTQELPIQDEKLRISLDFVTWKVRIGSTNWSLEEYAAPEIFNNLRARLQHQGVNANIEQPEFLEGSTRFSKSEAEKFAKVLWWMDKRFAVAKAKLVGGLTAPTLLYAHHFDLALVWFPNNDQKQVAIGFSTGDEMVPEPYIYGATYPNAEILQTVQLVEGARFQTVGFTGLVLPFDALQSGSNPQALFDSFAGTLFNSVKN
ncbi:MAG: DUF5996 family protein [Patescibacteria group bacterium]|nr:DUF5996 family protein [Patescibacteria group bacterium]